MPRPSPAYAHFWHKHKAGALSEMSLPPDLDLEHLHLLVDPIELTTVGDDWLSKCPWCNRWSLISSIDYGVTSAILVAKTDHVYFFMC